MAAVPLLLTAYQTLSKALRDLKDLPLAVVGVQAMSDALTHTAVFPPQPHPLAEQGGGEGSGRGGGSAVHLEPVEIAVQVCCLLSVRFLVGFGLRFRYRPGFVFWFGFGSGQGSGFRISHNL